MEKIILFSLITVALLLRLIFLSPWLEDWDSVQFALGLHQFSVVEHQPHPPGYPIYILLGKLVNLIFQNDTKSLTLLSAMLGTIAIIPLFYLTKKMFNSKTAFLATLLFIFIPVHWVLSEIAISNIPGLFFLLCAAYFLYTLEKSSFKVLVVGFFTGLILGVRATDMPIHLSLLLLLILRTHNLKFTIFLLFSFFTGISFWLIPTMFITGPREFIQATTLSANYVVWHDILGGQFFSFTNFLTSRIKNLSFLLNVSYTPYFLIISLFAIYRIFKLRNFLREFRYQFLGIWLLVYLCLLLLFYNLELPQYTLPLLPPLVIIVAATFSALIKNNFHNVFYLIFQILIAFLVFVSLPQVEKQSKNIPPTVAPVLYIKENFTKDEITLITTFTFRQFQYYAPEYRNYYGVANTPKDIQSDYVGIDYKPLKDQIPQLKKYAFYSTREYRHKDFYFPRLQQTNLYVLKRLD